MAINHKLGFNENTPRKAIGTKNDSPYRTKTVNHISLESSYDDSTLKKDAVMTDFIATISIRRTLIAHVLVDPAAEISLMTKHTYDQLNPQPLLLPVNNVRVNNANSSPMKILGKVVAKTSLTNMKTQEVSTESCTWYVTESLSNPAILCQNIIPKFKLELNSYDHMIQLKLSPGELSKDGQIQNPLFIAKSNTGYTPLILHTFGPIGQGEMVDGPIHTPLELMNKINVSPYGVITAKTNEDRTHKTSWKPMTGLQFNINRIKVEQDVSVVDDEFLKSKEVKPAVQGEEEIPKINSEDFYINKDLSAEDREKVKEILFKNIDSCHHK